MLLGSLHRHLFGNGVTMRHWNIFADILDDFFVAFHAVVPGHLVAPGHGHLFGRLDGHLCAHLVGDDLAARGSVASVMVSIGLGFSLGLTFPTASVT